MRLTCLRCGHQVEMTSSAGAATGSCICGHDYTYPRVFDTGVRPNARAAERSRNRAFRAAGLVKNVGGFALGLALLGILCFPMALAGAAVGIYCLTMLRGPVARYSGRPMAMWAVAIGVTVFVSEMALVVSWLQDYRLAETAALQDGAVEDLRALLRAQRLYHARSEQYGLFKAFDFVPRHGAYTLYLAPNELMPATRDGRSVVDPLPPGLSVGVGADGFTAAAVANLDDDAELDVWTLNAAGDIVHAQNDATDP